MSADVFAPLRELLRHRELRRAGLSLPPMSESAFAALDQLLREHAERGAVIEAIAIHCVRRAKINPFWGEVAEELPRISEEALDRLAANG